MGISVRLLVIEDEALIGMDIAAYLECAGYSVHTAHSPEEALHITKSEKFDLAVIDIQLGGKIDGLQLAALLDIPAVFITGLPIREFSEKRVLSKPIELGTLLKAVKAGIETKGG